jgi:uncharacterized glyoxalase superfamily protein PhnB
MATNTETTTTGTASGEAPAKTVWPCLNFADGPAMIRFLVDVLGFEERAVYTDDAGLVEHAELVWPEGGGIMCGSAGRGESPFSQLPTGVTSTYIVTDHPDARFEQVTAAGAEIVLGLKDEDYGSRGFAVRDPEGNLWSFGTYRGQ